MELDVNSCKKSWKNLYDQFRAIHNTIPKSGSSLNSIKPKWTFYSQLLFLTEVVKSRNTQSNILEEVSEKNGPSQILENLVNGAPQNVEPYCILEEEDTDTDSHVILEQPQCNQNNSKTTHLWHQFQKETEPVHFLIQY